MRRVFLSSTAKDLAEHRLEVAAAIERLRQATSRMETFVAEPGTPVEVCTREAAKADLLVAIVAHRYGWVPAVAEGGDGETSITWLEVKAAEAAVPAKPVLGFVVKLDFPWSHGKEQDDLVERPDDAAEIARRIRSLKTFKQHLGKRVRAEFTTPDNLALLVTAAVANWLHPDDGPPPGGGLDAYLAALERRTSFIDIQGIAARSGRVAKAGRHPIETLYTPLRSRARPETQGSPAADGEPEAGLRGETVSLASLLPAHRRLLIEGQPGAGKSTFARLVACMLARDRLRRPAPGGGTWSALHLGLAPVAGGAPVPILLAMGDLVPLLADRTRPRHMKKELYLLDLLDAACKASELDVGRATWQRLLETGQAWLLLDGLDEVAEERLREQAFDVLRDALAAWPGCAFLVTSRPIETGALAAIGFHAATVAPFGPGEIEAFLRRWVAAHHGDAAEDLESRRYLADLTGAIAGRSRIRQLAGNPVMLTCLAVVHWNQRRLPDGKERVYAAVVDWLLEAKKERRDEAGYQLFFARTAFARLALAMMGGAGGAKRTTFDAGDAALAIDDVAAREWPGADPEERRRRARDWLRFECLGSGVVEEVGVNRLRFWHLTFQEYLAALQLAWLEDGDGERAWWPAVRGRLGEAQWRETVDFLPGCLLHEGGPGRVDRLLERVLASHGSPDQGLAGQARAAGIVGRLLEHVKVYGYKPEPRVEEAYRRALERSMEMFTLEGARKVPWRDRVAAAEALGQGGDPRLRSARDNFRPVPGRPEVLLGLYPVTVEEFGQLVDDRGYEREDLWSQAGWAERLEKAWEAPGSWDEQLRTPNRPVVEVSWYEAEAYCAWLARFTGLTARLPSEDEWYAAANHPDGDYPWGRAEPTEELANFAPNWSPNVGAPTPVGIYPAGAGPGGHLDLAGNVWELCADEVEVLDDDDRRLPRRARRGGGWHDSDDVLRAAFRGYGRLDERRVVNGFRVAVSSASTVGD